MKVTIKPRHILQGTPDDSCTCAVALAVKESLCSRDEKVRVEGDGNICIWWYDKHSQPQEVLLEQSVEQRLDVQEFVSWYDLMYKEYVEQGMDDTENAELAEAYSFDIELDRKKLAYV